MIEILYVTGNSDKFNTAKEAFSNTKLQIKQISIDTPEIQSKSVEQVAKFKAKWASNKLQKPVLVTDAGFYIDALNGFPGPFIKYVNEWFSPNDFIRLMEEKENRSITIKDCLAYCIPNEEPIIFTGKYYGELSTKPGNGKGSTIEQLFIPKGFSSPICEINTSDMLAYWSSGDILSKFKIYILS